LKSVDKPELNPIMTANTVLGFAPLLPFTDQLIAVATAYSEATGTTLSTLSTRLFNGGSRLQSIAAGGDLNTRNFENAMQWFSDNWPEDLPWPAGAGRPARERATQAAE
jgi:hypothetical protein